MVKQADLLIIGAGPFGMSMAAYAAHHEMDHLVVGKPMDFWKSNMPHGMNLRSGCDWHLDPLDVHTIESYLQTKNLTPADVEPLSLEFYLNYAEWFQEQKDVRPIISLVQRLDYLKGAGNRFEASMDDGEVIRARNVLVAIGFGYFKNIPTELAEILPEGSFSHTCNLVEFKHLKAKRCLIIGGRQSAFEWAALLHEEGAAAVHVCHRHETPSFKESDWSWVSRMVDTMVEHLGWYRNLSPEQSEQLSRRFWAEGRLKLEPWLWPRVNNDAVRLWPNSHVVACRERLSGVLEVKLDIGATLEIDHVILASGYKVNMAQVPFLDDGNVLSSLRTKDGYPVLNDRFQSSIPGLYFTSMPAAQDFGPFFAFTVSVNASAKIIGTALTRERVL